MLPVCLLFAGKAFKKQGKTGKFTYNQVLLIEKLLINLQLSHVCNYYKGPRFLTRARLTELVGQQSINYAVMAKHTQMSASAHYNRSL